MSQPDLRLVSAEESTEAQRVCVSLGDLAPWLLHAASHDRLWLRDFEDDPVEISQDLYEVLLAYRRLATSPPVRSRAA